MNLEQEIAHIKSQTLEAGQALHGVYWEKINGVLVGVTPNIVTNEGLNKTLKVMFGADSKISAWYIALWNNAIDPASTWTAANFTATAGEITSTSEGYSGANRILWNPVVPSANVIDNVGQEASFTIVCTTTITVWGAALISAQARGATTGILASAARYATIRTLSNGDTYEVGYRLTATSV